jgi:putative peptidoglycan lipid II flippase
MFFNALSLVLGLFRDRLFSEIVGAGHTLDIYMASFRLPDMLYALLFSFVSATTVIPLLSKAISENNKKEEEKQFLSLFNFFGVAMVLMSLVGCVLMPYIAHIIAPGFDAASTAELIYMSRLLLLQPILLGITNVISCLAQAKNNFLAFGISGAVYNIGIIFGIIFLYPMYGLHGLAYGVLLGAFVGICVQSFTLYQERIHFRFLINMNTIRKHFELATPRVGSLFLLQSKNLITTSFATLTGAGSLTLFTFATQLRNIQLQVLTTSLASAIMPRLSGEYSRGETKSFHQSINLAIRYTVSLSILITLVSVLLAPLIVQIIYGTKIDISLLVQLFVILVISVPASNISVIVNRADFARGNTRTQLHLQLFAAVLLCVFSYFAYHMGYGIVGLAYAFTLVQFIEGAIMWLHYWRTRNDQLKTVD